MDAVVVRDLEFEGNHGYSAAERRGTRRFRVTATLECDLGVSSQSDKLVDTIDYWKVSDAMVRIGTGSTYKLLEALAGAMANAIHELYPTVGITIELDKLAPPCPGVPASCGVRLRRPPRR